MASCNLGARATLADRAAALLHPSPDTRTGCAHVRAALDTTAAGRLSRSASPEQENERLSRATHIYYTDPPDYFVRAFAFCINAQQRHGERYWMESMRVELQVVVVALGVS